MLKIALALVLSVAASGCYVHTQSPGEVRVIEYGPNADFVEVELNHLGVRGEEATLWVTAAASFEPEQCSPVQIDVRRGGDDGDDGTGTIASAVALESARGTYPVTDGTISVQALADAVAWPPVVLTADGETVTLHDEHLYNLRAFVQEMRCSDSVSSDEPQD